MFSLNFILPMIMLIGLTYGFYKVMNNLASDIEKNQGA